jgi:hypothetical protein
MTTEYIFTGWESHSFQRYKEVDPGDKTDQRRQFWERLTRGNNSSFDDHQVNIYLLSGNLTHFRSRTQGTITSNTSFDNHQIYIHRVGMPLISEVAHRHDPIPLG